MNKPAQMLSICVVTLAALAAMSSDASADYLVSVWGNNAPLAIQGSYRWGNGPWKPFYIEPGRSGSTWCNLMGGPQTLEIRFDADPGPGIDFVNYRLRTYINPTTVFESGPTEVFHIRNNGRIDISNTRN